MIADAVLFDLDGTLVDTRALYFEAYRTAVEPYIRDDLTDEDIKALRPTSELAFLRAVVAEADFDACLEDFYRAYRDLHPRDVVFPGVTDLLGRLRERGVPLGLVTGKSRRSWEITRERAPGLGAFQTMVFDDDVRAPKPDPHGLELALGILGVDPARAAYVGDTRSDMEAARSAGLRPMAALWSRSPEDREIQARRVREVGASVLQEPLELTTALGL